MRRRRVLQMWLLASVASLLLQVCFYLKEQAQATGQPLVELTFDRVRIPYAGPQVYGWPPERDRNMTAYIRPGENNFILVPSLNSCDVLLVIASSVRAKWRRSAIRRTWASEASASVATVFVVGTSPSAEDMRSLKEEAERNADLLQADFVDHYSNLTLKTVFALKYFTEHIWTKPPLYFGKFDDDIYVNLDNLMSVVKSIKQSKFVIGQHIQQKEPIKIPQTLGQPRPRYASKWQVPRYMFNGKEFPTAVSGAGYVMSGVAARSIYKAALQLPFFHLEDVFVTGFCAQNCAVRVVNSDIFHCDRAFAVALVEDDFVLADAAVLHYVSSKDIMRIHKIMAFDKLREDFYNLNKSLSEFFMKVPTNHIIDTFPKDST